MTFAEQAMNVPALGGDVMLVVGGEYRVRWLAPGGMTGLEQTADRQVFERLDDGGFLYFRHAVTGARLGPLATSWLREVRPC